MQGDVVEIEETENLSKDWSREKIKDIGEVVLGTTPSTKDEKNWNGNIPFITPGDLNGYKIRRTERAITEEGLVESRKLPKNTVVVSCIGDIGKIGITLMDIAMSNQQQNSIIANPRHADSYFILYLIKHLKHELDNYASMTTVPILNKTNFSNIEIPIPPLSEQRKIAAILTAVQNAIEQTEAVIQATRELKKAMMKHLFTYGPVPVDQTVEVELKETEIGNFNCNWSIEKIGEHFEINQGKALSKKHREGKRPRPFLRTSNVYWGTIDTSELDEMDFTGKEEQKYKLKKGDLLICEGGDIGRTAILENDLDGVYYQNHLFRVRNKHAQILPTYLMYWMEYSHNIKNVYEGSGNRTTIANLSKSRLSNFKFPLPKLKDQEYLTLKLAILDKKINQEVDKKDSSEILFNSLLENLMTAKIRVG